MGACTCFTGPGGSISENGVGNAFAVLVKLFSNRSRIRPFFPGSFLSAGLLGMRQWQYKVSLTVIVLTLWHFAVVSLGNSFMYPSCMHCGKRGRRSVTQYVCSSGFLPLIQRAGCKGKRIKPTVYTILGVDYKFRDSFTWTMDAICCTRYHDTPLPLKLS